ADWFHCRYLVSVHLALFVANRNIFARTEDVSAKAVTAFVVIFRSLIVIEHPSAVLRSARPVQQEAVLIILTFRKSSHAAKIAMPFPRGDIDMAITIERSDELVAIPLGALGELLGASEIEPDTFETARHGRHGRSPTSVIMVVIIAQSGKGNWIED